MNSEELIRILKEFQRKYPEELVGEEKRLFDTIMEIADDRDKYKSLYENEKDHTDTLKRIIDYIRYYIEENGNQMSEECTFDILNLLKEIR